MTDKPTPTDAELNTILCAHWPAFAAQSTLVKIWVRDAVQDAIDKWGQPAQATKCECTMAQRCTGSGCRYCNPQEYIDMLHDQIAENEPAQTAEPVAWLEYARKKPSSRRLVFTRSSRKDLRSAGWVAEPLYTAPQPVAREPLSHAQAKALVLKYGNDPLNLVFQVELAHGIKGGQHGADSHP